MENLPKGAGILKYYEDLVSNYEFEAPSTSTVDTSLLTAEESVSPIILLKNIRYYIDDTYKHFTGSERKLMYITKYLVDASDISGYQLLSRDRLMIFLMLDGQNWRSHSFR